jgi:hypothetical protein
MQTDSMQSHHLRQQLMTSGGSGKIRLQTPNSGNQEKYSALT